MKTPIIILRGFFCLNALGGSLTAFMLGLGALGCLMSHDVLPALGAFLLGALEAVLAVRAARFGWRLRSYLAHPAAIYRWGKTRMVLALFYGVLTCGMGLVSIPVLAAVLYDVRSRQCA